MRSPESNGLQDRLDLGLLDISGAEIPEPNLTAETKGPHTFAQNVR